MVNFAVYIRLIIINTKKMKQIKKLIGMRIESIFVKHYLYNNIPMGVIEMFLYDAISYYSIICSEGIVIVHTMEKCPESIYEDNYKYQIEKLNMDWVSECRVSSISLVCSNNLKNGIVIFFDNGHNIVFYNTSYENGDEDVFEIDGDVQKLKDEYRLVNYFNKI